MDAAEAAAGEMGLCWRGQGRRQAAPWGLARPGRHDGAIVATIAIAVMDQRRCRPAAPEEAPECPRQVPCSSLPWQGCPADRICLPGSHPAQPDLHCPLEMWWQIYFY